MLTQSSLLFIKFLDIYKYHIIVRYSLLTHFRHFHEHFQKKKFYFFDCFNLKITLKSAPVFKI